jgi:hypothetical protein
MALNAKIEVLVRNSNKAERNFLEGIEIRDRNSYSTKYLVRTQPSTIQGQI